MTNAETSTFPAGWYPDPAGTPRSRLWDGTQWTEHYYDPRAGLPAQPLRAPAGTAPYTVWIWLVTFLPLLSLVSLFTFDFGGYFRSYLDASLRMDPTASTFALFSPSYILLSALSWVISGVIVVFAYLDWKELKRRNVPAPFHWAWAFLGPVYPIGRSVIARRRTGRGIAPMWTTIAIEVAVTIGMIVWVTVMMVEMMRAVMPLVDTGV